MKRRKSKQVIAAQRLKALAIARLPETALKHQRLAVRTAERELLASDAAMKPYRERRLADGLAKLAAMEAALIEAEAGEPAIILATLSDLPTRWMPLSEAATRLGVHPAHLARRCRQTLCKARQAVRVAIHGRQGPMRWYVDRSITGDQSTASPN